MTIKRLVIPATGKVFFILCSLILFFVNNTYSQVPSITSFSPEQGQVGSNVTITGNNFGTSNTLNSVYFGGVKAEIISSDITSLIVKVPVGASYKPVTVTSNGLIAYSSKSFNPTFSGANAVFSKTSFGNRMDLTIGTTSMYGGADILSGDLDGDGLLDLVATNSVNNNLAIFKNSGQAVLFSASPTIKLTTGTSPIATVNADINGDGLTDLITLNSVSNNFSVYINNSTSGTISFNPAVNFATASSPQGLTVGDLNGDGKLDLAIACLSAGTTSVFKNTSNAGSISFEKSDYTLYQPGSILMSDLDSDQKPELIVGHAGTTYFSVLKNTSSGSAISFAAAKLFAATGVQKLVSADLDGDGRNELAFTSSTGTSVTVLKNTSASGVISFNTISVPVRKYPYEAANPLSYSDLNPYGLTLEDLDGDGKPDLALGNKGWSLVSVLKNTSIGGSVSFSQAAYYETTYDPRSVATGDFNSDNLPDIAVLGYQEGIISVLTSQVTKPFVYSYKKVNGSDAENILITGTNFTGTSSVTIAGSEVKSFTLISETSIKAAVNDNLAGDIAVTTPIGTGILKGFSNITSPVVNGFSPLLGPVGTEVTITGDNFSTNISSNKVFFGAVKANIIAAEKTSLKVAVPPGISYQPVTVISNNLNASSTLSFNITFPDGNAVFSTTSFAPKTELTGNNGNDINAIASADLDGDGKPDLVATDHYKDAVLIFKNTGSKAAPFSSNANLVLPAGDATYGLSVADFNNDGKPDIAVVSENSDRAFIFKNTSTNGTISFATLLEFKTGYEPFKICSGDLDNDGRPDLAVLSRFTYNVSILRNISENGNIDFAGRLDFGYAGNDITMGDIDADGWQDLTISPQGSGMVTVLRNISTNGGINFMVNEFKLTTTGHNGITIGDLDGDQKPDVAAITGSNIFSVIRNTSTPGSVSFSPPQTYLIGKNTSSTAISLTDLEGDGKPDVVIANSNSDSLSVYRNLSSQSSIGFAPPVTYLTGSSPYGLAMADYDNDGKPDIAVANNGGTKSGSISLLKNQVIEPTLKSFKQVAEPGGYDVLINGTNLLKASSLTFGGKPAQSFSIISANAILAIAPKNTEGSISVTTPYGSATLTGFNNIPIPTITSFSPVSASAGSIITITGTNFNDTAEGNSVYFGAVKATITYASTTTIKVIVPTGATYQPISVICNTLTAFSSKPFILTFPSESLSPTLYTRKSNYLYTDNKLPLSVNIADFNNDGKSELIITCTGGQIQIFQNTTGGGANWFSPGYYSNLYGNDSNPLNTSYGDLNGDGKLDLLVSNGNSSTVSVFRNTSTGQSISFANKLDLTVASTPYVFIRDLDGDGKAEIISANLNSNTISVLKNTTIAGVLSFAPKIDFATGTGPGCISVADLDGDGRPELLVANRVSKTVSVFKNNCTPGSISFSSKTDFDALSSPFDLKTADIDGDDKTDIVLTNNSTNSILILKNTSVNGAISFSERLELPTGNSPYYLSIGDMDGDGLVDIASGNLTNAAVHILKNRSTPGALSFGPYIEIATPNPNGIATGDLDGDGIVELIVANYNPRYLTILSNSRPSAPPVIDSFYPQSAAKGSIITVTGSNFSNATEVRFGNVKATSFNIISPLALTAVVGDGASGELAVTTSAGTASKSGFIHAGSGTLPLSLKYFTSRVSANTIRLTWETTNEINTSIFEVERKSSGNWDKIAEVKAAGESNSKHSYAFYDNDPFFGDNYYRLKMVDKDGLYKYSEITFTNFTLDEPSEILVYPVPLQEYVVIESNGCRISTARLLSTDGKTINTWQLKPDKTTINLPQLSSNASYILVLYSETGEILKRIKLIK